MKLTLNLTLLCCLLQLFQFSHTACAEEPTARDLVHDAILYWRDRSSRMIAKMQVHRADFKRTSSLTTWTKGMDRSLVRFTYPEKDAGNATLTINEEVWTFNPKTTRVIKIPPSMKSQSWMGSDFSYQDLSKDDQIIDEYEHRFIGEEQSDGQKVRIVESVPKESAPIVWGKEELAIREDKIILRHKFFDQEQKLVKELSVLEVGLLGGKKYPLRVRMSKAEKPEEWTEIVHEDATFGMELSETFFSQSNLQNPRAE